MVPVFALVAARPGTLSFGQHAKLSASCPADRQPAVDFFKPLQLADIVNNPGQNVTAQLRGVPYTCVDIPIDEPCASHTRDRPGNFFCLYTGTQGTETVGPLSAEVVPHYIEPSALPVAYAVVLHCPAPSFDGIVRISGPTSASGAAQATLSIAHGTRTPGEVGVNIPFEGMVGGDEVSFVELPTPPSPPSLPPPSVPPFTHHPVERFVYSGDEVQTLQIKTGEPFIMKAWGAAGGSSHGTSGVWRGGSGAYVAAQCTLPYATTLYIRVGQGGGSGTADTGRERAYGGGGKAGCCDYASGYGGGGGGLSGVFLTDALSQDSALLVAGAGGGSGGNHGGNGGGGGFARGQDSTDGYFGDGSNCYGRGGGQSAGGAGGYGGRTGNGGPGGALRGGDGHSSQGTSAGGGGSGWYGGGAAAGYYCGGGGGSSFVDSSRCTLIKSVDGQVGSGVPSGNSAAPAHPSADHDSSYIPGVAVAGKYREAGGDGLVVLNY